MRHEDPISYLERKANMRESGREKKTISGAFILGFLTCAAILIAISYW
ncbi:MAG: hypothetical protein AB3N20_12795 [Rhizobiaceae bacterium]